MPPTPPPVHLQATLSWPVTLEATRTISGLIWNGLANTHGTGTRFGYVLTLDQLAQQLMRTTPCRGCKHTPCLLVPLYLWTTRLLWTQLIYSHLMHALSDLVTRLSSMGVIPQCSTTRNHPEDIGMPLTLTIPTYHPAQ